MRYRRRAASAFVLLGLAIAACRRQPPKPPLSPSPPPVEFGVHVASAANAMASLRFKVTVTGSLELGIRAPFFAMQRDKSLILSTPADLLVNKGTGSAVIAAADSSAILTVMPLDSSDVGVASARGHAVRIERVGDTRHLTAAPVSPLPKVKR